MRTKFLLTLAASFGMLLSMVGTAEAQIVTITNANYVPPAPGRTDISVKPQGVYSVPANQVTDTWQIVIDYGTIPNGAFTPMPGGPTVALPVTPVAGGGPFNWAQAVATGINNPPAGLAVRARLQRKDFFGVFRDKSTAYMPLTPIAPGGGGT